MLIEIILWAVLAVTFYFCGALLVIAWLDRPMVMRDPETKHWTSVRGWQKEHGYVLR